MTEFPSITPPDPEVAAAARARQDRLTKPPGSLGRLEDLSVWVASCQGVCPPRQFQRPRVVVFAGDHGVTAAGVSAYPAEVTAQMVANFDAGGAAINVLAEAAGATGMVGGQTVDLQAAGHVAGGASAFDPDALRATYCQGGVRAAAAWFVLSELLSIPEVRNYSRSWEEWGNRKDTPIEGPGTKS